MVKIIKSLFALSIALAVMIGASGFSFIIHHCNTGNHTEFRLSGQNPDLCCNLSAHMDQVQPEDGCCQEEEQNRQNYTEELKHQCCEESLINFESLPVFLKSDSSDRAISLAYLPSSEINFTNQDSPVSHLNSFSSPPKPCRKLILVFNQSFLL